MPPTAGWAQRLGPADERDPDSPVKLAHDRSGKIRLHLSPLEAVPEPPSLLALRETVARMMPRVDLPEVLLEVDAWTGYLGEFAHAGLSTAAARTRMRDLSTSMAAVLIAQGCNLGFAPIIKPGNPALTRDRLSHVSQNYVCADTLAAANGRLITAQSRVDVAQLWGGGLLASVDGLRFVVPVRSLDAGPNPRYFGQGRGIAWLNAINDQVAGIGGVVVTGTMRDSLHVLDVIVGRDGGPPPTMIATDTASYSDIVFGLFRLLGYQFSPRLADLPDQRPWRLTVPGAPRADYGPMNVIARQHLSFEKIRSQWPDILRVAGSLHTGTVAGYELLRMLGRDGNPTPLGAAFAEYGRAENPSPAGDVRPGRRNIPTNRARPAHRPGITAPAGPKDTPWLPRRGPPTLTRRAGGPAHRSRTGPQRHRPVEHPLHRRRAESSTSAGISRRRRRCRATVTVDRCPPQRARPLHFHRTQQRRAPSPAGPHRAERRGIPPGQRITASYLSRW
jgi:TnpA family transposase